MARMSSEDGMVMQIHPGSLRDHNRALFARFGSDKGADIPLTTEYTRNLRNILNEYGNHPRFRLVLFKIGRATSELQSLMRISYAVFCLKKKKKKNTKTR